MSSKAEEFDRQAREVFAPAYPAIAAQFLEESGVYKGVCLDLGCGSGYLGLAFAEQSLLDIYLMDNDPEMLAIAKRNVVNRHLEKRVKLMQADVHRIPLESNSVQLVVSRGSMFFWQDQVLAFNEIYRVLAPGGKAFIGGGFGSPEIKRQIDQEMQRRSPDWLEHLRSKIGPDAPGRYRAILSKTDIVDYDIDYGAVGLWVVFGKKEFLGFI
ncbi:MAG: class I SAM-dependent methyltransferase [Syntrophomonas sp.]